MSFLFWGLKHWFCGALGMVFFLIVIAMVVCKG